MWILFFNTSLLLTTNCKSGGYDAIFCLTIGDEAATKVQTFWTTYPDANVTPLVCREQASSTATDDFEAGIRVDEIKQS